MPATTKQQVEQQSLRDRIWEAMDYGYGKKREALEKSYDKSYSSADRQLLSRGMQRSSYGAQTLANINQERDKALGDVWSEQIADYQNRLTDQEDKEWERAFQERQLEQNQNQFEMQFGEGQRQFNENLAYQKERAGVADAQWQAQFDYGKERDAVADQQWQTQFDYGKERDAVADQQWQAQFDYQTSRDAVADQQWQQAFDADRASEDREYAVNFVSQILANGQMPTDEMLAAAGISKEDAEKLMAQAAEESSSGSSNGGSNPPPADTGDGDDEDKPNDNSFVNQLGASFGEFSSALRDTLASGGKYLNDAVKSSWFPGQWPSQKKADSHQTVTTATGNVRRQLSNDDTKKVKK